MSPIEPEPPKNPEPAPRDAVAKAPSRAPQASASNALSLRAATLYAAASGLLYFLAFPGMDVWPLGFVALTPLALSLRGQTPRRALFLGWVAGLFMTLFGFYWLLEMLETFSGFGLPLCLLFLLLLSAYQGGRIALLGWFSARCERKGHGFEVAFTLAFIASELAFPLLFPWYYGGIVHGVPALIQVAELGGPIAIGLLLLAPNLALAEFFEARRARRALRRRMIAGALLVPMLALIYGSIRIRSVDAKTARAPQGWVGIVQANMSLFGKRENLGEGLRRHQELTRQLVGRRAFDLVVWSETSVMSAVWEHEASSHIYQAIGRHMGAPALFGAVLARPVDDARGHVVLNSALLTDKSGRVVGRYDKHYRLPFGEYLPLGDTFPILYEWSPNSGRFAKGSEVTPLRLGEHSIATFICYEDVIPAFVRSIVRSGEPDLLVNLTNDAWFGDTTEPWIHLALAKLRAVEHRRFFVRSTNSGVSAIIDPVGRVVAHTPTFEEATLEAPIAWLRGTTGYALWGDLPWWLCAAASAIGAFVRTPRLAGLRGSLSKWRTGQRRGG